MNIVVQKLSSNRLRADSSQIPDKLGAGGLPTGSRWARGRLMAGSWLSWCGLRTGSGPAPAGSWPAPGRLWTGSGRAGSGWAPGRQTHCGLQVGSRWAPGWLFAGPGLALDRLRAGSGQAPGWLWGGLRVGSRQAPGRLRADYGQNPNSFGVASGQEV